jgi:hypothetical protein
VWHVLISALLKQETPKLQPFTKKKGAKSGNIFKNSGSIPLTSVLLDSIIIDSTKPNLESIQQFYLQNLIPFIYQERK